MVQGLAWELSEPQTIEARHVEIQVNIQLDAEAYEKKESLGTSPADYLRETEGLWTTEQVDRVRSSPGEPDIDPVVELGTESACFR